MTHPRSQARYFGLIACLLILAGCAQRPSIFAEVAPAGRWATIVVMQTDVLSINGEAVHLADAVTPQASPDARCAAEAIAARRTAQQLKALSTDIRTFTVTPTGLRDEANRPYAHVLLDGVDPAHDLVADGLAVAPRGKRFDWCGPMTARDPRAAHIADLSFSGT